MSGLDDQVGKKTVIVAGDAAVDWFEVSTPSVESQNSGGQFHYNWQSHPGFKRFARPGGALLLAHFLKKTGKFNLISPSITDIQSLNPDQVIQSFATLDKFPYSISETQKSVYRLSEWKGLAASENVKHLQVNSEVDSADLVVFDDAGNGFRDCENVWMDLTSIKEAAYVLKMSRPLGEGKLWNALTELENPVILVIEADDLRTMDVKISRSLSWERTAQDFVWQMSYNRYIEFLRKADYLVVRFGADGAILFNNTENGYPARLFFDPKSGEQGTGIICPGKMSGVGDAFATGLITGLVEHGHLDYLGEAVRRGVLFSKKMWKEGFGSDLEALDYQYRESFSTGITGDILIADTEIPRPAPETDQVYWCILEELPTFVEFIATNSVLTGKDESLERVPLGQFGNLVTLDRSEIESFNSIKNLVNEYLQSPSVKRPLCIGVFGPPGSGKSFGVTEVVKSIAPEIVPDKPLEFNLSQFNALEDLITSFHKVRDVALQGVVPLVFFDEFDSEFNGEKLGWLKYFLAPMQDGLFRDGEVLHPLGKSIFIFAGGTRSTFEEFSAQENSQSFRDAKGSDFISRLRGFINIKGPNPIGGDMRKDRLSMIRRATVLRFLLLKHAPQLFKAKKKCSIDRGVLHAFIKVPHYKHGIRSMQSIIEMSSLAGRKRFEQAALPSPEQLELHVNAEAFQRIVMREVIFSAARENIARAIHENYRESVQDKRPEDEISMLPWDQLPDDLKASNLEQADHIPEKLRQVKCDFIPITDREIEMFNFKPEEIETLAELEHERFVEEKERRGWKQGTTRCNDKKIRTDLLPWEELSEELKDLDRNAVKAIPQLLARAGLEIYRLN